MAYTKIIKVKSNLNLCLDYTSNPMKTERRSAEDLNKLLNYTQNNDKTEHQLYVMAMPAFADDPLTTINNLSDFVFSAIKAIGAILLGFGIVQIGLALKGHDASQRAQGFMTFFTTLP